MISKLQKYSRSDLLRFYDNTIAIYTEIIAPVYSYNLKLAKQFKQKITANKSLKQKISLFLRS